MKLRTAALTDLDVIADYNIALAFETEDLKLRPEVVRAGVEVVLKDSTRGLYFVAESGGAVVGQVMITHEWSDWRNGDIWWLQSVYVRKDYRRQGIFKALFNHVVEEAKARGDVCDLRLYMEADNTAARASYRRMGMEELSYVIFDKPVR